MSRPDFSPLMLALFLRARAEFRVADSSDPLRRTETVRAEKTALRKAARVTVRQFNMAWMGRLPTPEPRQRLWNALGHDPSGCGIRLVHGGQERAY
ncbi:MAG: hypothetical protein Rhirs2KO_09720 [Rhizobiaceae bacterium]